jgi:PKD repeat protein
MKKPILFAVISLFVTLGFQVNAQTSVFNWDVDNPHYIQPVDVGPFLISYYDMDGLTPNAASGIPISSFIAGDDGSGTNDVLFATSWFTPAAQANNWVVFGPITHPANVTSVLTWKHRYWDNTFRDGYEVLVSATGPSPASFSGATVIKTFTDNDALTNNHLTLTTQTASIPAAFNGGPVYIAFHHTGNDQLHVLFDDFDVTQTTGTAPTTDFVASSTSITAGSSVNFTDLSADSPTQWAWTFTGASTPTSSVQNPSSIVYPTAGCYEVVLTATNAFGADTETKTCYINVGNAPTTDFSANFTSITAGGSVDFTDLSTESPTQWAWTFTGASTPTSSVQNPSSIVYPTAGCYEVELTATNAFGSDTETKTCYINVGNAPTTDFSANFTSITAGGSVDFTDLSTDSPTQWAWTFTGASTPSSSVQNPTSIVYPTVGCFEVVLTATNTFGNDTETKTCYIDVTPAGSAPVADFSGTPVTLQVGGSVNFTDLSTNTPTQWAWTFTGASTPSSSAQNPTNIVYPTMGCYEVALTATNSFGNDTETKTCYIDVTCPAINSSFTWVNNLNGTVQFTNTSTGMESYDWDFGDTQNSTVTDPLHIYAAPGNYLVTLTGTDSDCSNGTDLDTMTITVTDTTLGVSALELEQLYQMILYPNPSDGNVTISFEVNKGQGAQVSVFNLLGEEVLEQDLGTVNGQVISQVDLTAMPKGVYLLRLVIGDDSMTKQVVVK